MLIRIVFLLSVWSFSIGAWAWDVVPECMNRDSSIPVDNQQVITWKYSTRNQFQARAHIQGTIRKVYPNRNGHRHFAIQIGSESSDVIEVIYNQEFGPLPQLTYGAQVEACGDYITSTAPSGPYPKSPDGAIIHWVHKSPSPARHPSGFLLVNGILCGQN